MKIGDKVRIVNAHLNDGRLLRIYNGKIGIIIEMDRVAKGWTYDFILSIPPYRAGLDDIVFNRDEFEPLRKQLLLW